MKQKNTFKKARLVIMIAIMITSLIASTSVSFAALKTYHPQRDSKVTKLWNSVFTSAGGSKTGAKNKKGSVIVPTKAAYQYAIRKKEGQTYSQVLKGSTISQSTAKKWDGEATSKKLYYFDVSKTAHPKVKYTGYRIWDASQNQFQDLYIEAEVTSWENMDMNTMITAHQRTDCWTSMALNVKIIGKSSLLATLSLYKKVKKKMTREYNTTMVTDFYEIAMANGFFNNGMSDDIAYYDMFFRAIPDNGGFAIVAGLSQVIEFIEELQFTDKDDEYLVKRGFPQEFIDRVKNFKFSCDIWAIPEGTPVFPGEPLLTVRGPAMQAQFLETMILLLINHQSLIATKANRIVRAAQGRPVMEFGTRRAHGTTAAVLGARAAYIAGCAGTACVAADRDFGVPAMGTMSHSWVQMFDTEYDAFKSFAELYPDNATLLVDTYDVLRSGLPAAIKVFKELDPPKKGIRIDSGDIAYLTKQARKMLDDEGLTDCKIIASNSLDEYIIRDVLLEGAQIDSFGVGERLITSSSEPVFGGVYKLAAIERNDELIPRMKISENIEKITNPGSKVLYRIYDNESDRAIADLITLEGEQAPSVDGYEIFDQWNVWKRKRIKNFYVKNLREQIYDAGKLIYKEPTLEEIREHCSQEVEALWEETKRFENPQPYIVDLSHDLWELKQELIEEHMFND